MCDIIPIDSEISKFSQYLNNNIRGILSARFGDGKSFFLNEIKERLSQSYTFITIYPSITKSLKIKTSLSISSAICCYKY